MNLLTMLYITACGLIFYSAFCRLVLVSPSVLLRVRLVFVALGCAAAFCVFSVLFWHYRPDVPDALLACAVSAVLMVASTRWRDGVPSEYETDRGELAGTD